ncbi:zinc finger, CCHC-type containing protein, partial [Tanacetum coccineum]
MNTIELPEGNNVAPLQSDTIRLVQNECSLYELRSEDPNQHLKDFLKLVDSLDLDVANRERTHVRLFQLSLCDKASNWLERLPIGSISTWEDPTARFLAQFFPSSGRTTKLRNDILMFQQHQGESLSKAWTLDCAAEGQLRKVSVEKAWATIEELARYEDEGWNDPCKVGTLIENAIALMERSKSIFGMSSNMMRRLPPELSRQKAFEDLVMNFILDQEERVKQLEEYMGVTGSDFMQLTLE